MDGNGQLYSDHVTSSPPRPPWVGHLAGLAILWGSAWFLYQGFFFAPEPRVDEVVYLAAVDAVAAGGSPYEDPHYIYTPAFAGIILAARESLGGNFLPVIRGLCLFGTCLVAWFSLSLVSWPWLVRLLLGIVVLHLSPSAVDALWTGNVSPLVIGGLVTALFFAHESAVSSGAVIGFLNAAKPMGVPILVILAAQYLGHPDHRWCLKAVLSALVTGGVTLLLGLEYLPEMLERHGGKPYQLGNISFNRVLYLVGLEVSSVVIFLVVVAIAVMLTFHRRLDRRELVVLGSAVSLLALPLINPSSFLLSWPVQAVALERVVTRFRQRPNGAAGRWRFYELGLVGAMILSPHGSIGLLAAGALPVLGQAVVTLMPLLAVVGLLAYCLGGHGLTRAKKDRLAAAVSPAGRSAG